MRHAGLDHDKVSRHEGHHPALFRPGILNGELRLAINQVEPFLLVVVVMVPASKTLFQFDPGKVMEPDPGRRELGQLTLREVQPLEGRGIRPGRHFEQWQRLLADFPAQEQFFGHPANVTRISEGRNHSTQKGPMEAGPDSEFPIPPDSKPVLPAGLLIRSPTRRAHRQVSKYQGRSAVSDTQEDAERSKEAGKGRWFHSGSTLGGPGIPAMGIPARDCSGTPAGPRSTGC